MVERKTFPAYGGYSIAVASEQMRDGKWAAVATVTQSTGTAQRAIDLPVPDERFDTEAEAANVAFKTAMEWIDQNTPRSEGPSSPGPSKVA